jgi:hypothetical protein
LVYGLLDSFSMEGKSSTVVLEKDFYFGRFDEFLEFSVQLAIDFLKEL